MESDTGYAAIEWSAAGPVTLQLTDSADRQPARTLYSGQNKAFFLSGLADGDYILTLRDDRGDVSPPLRLVVRHQSLSRAILLAGLGALVFLAIVFTILRGARDD